MSYKADHPKQKRLARKRKVADRYDSSTRSIDRWTADPKLNFPQPIEINGHKFWDEDELDSFDRARTISHVRKAA